ncbi:ChaN family lipoprotein [Flexithrix dorotheae]|uniref:ChaN family lipoprotein n=1 Tax=Flexithrix dorotheae TaxID=70993 RepID=UPI00039CAA81|nr:ChaN family lipoprotein [Flexithrix dorotheae]
MPKTINSLFIIFFMSSFLSDKPAYLLYDKEGKPTNFSAMTNVLADADVILFGELHNNPISHWLQLQVTKDLYAAKKEDLILGAEMFEADDQLILNEYLQNLIKSSHFEKEAKIWNNYGTDYAPLVEFAKSNQLNFVATNIPRRYASLVSRQGLQALDHLEKEAKSYIAPLPIKTDLELPGYKKMIEMMGGHGGDMKPENFAYAQAIKDATMSHFILKHWKKGKTIIHYNGAYHSNNFEGIGWYLKESKPKLKIITISTVEQNDINTLEEKNKSLADFTIVIPSDMTKTY